MELEYFILYKCGDELINTTITIEKIESKKDICDIEKRLEKSTAYKAGTRIEIYIPQGYEKQDIISIAEEMYITKLQGVKK